MFGKPAAGSTVPPSQPMSPTYHAPSGATGAFQAPPVPSGAQAPMAALAQSGPSEYTQLISRPANLGGGAPAQPPQQAQGQPMMQPMVVPGMQPPVLQPPVLQPPVLQPPMMQPPFVQPPMMQPPVIQAPMVQPPMMAVPAPQPAKGKFPWLLVAIVFLMGILVASGILLFVLKH